MTEPKIDPVLQAQLDHLFLSVPGWHDDERDRWCDLFVASVHMLYPTKPRRPSRAKKGTEQ